MSTQPPPTSNRQRSQFHFKTSCNLPFGQISLPVPQLWLLASLLASAKTIRTKNRILWVDIKMPQNPIVRHRIFCTMAPCSCSYKSGLTTVKRAIQKIDFSGPGFALATACANDARFPVEHDGTTEALRKFSTSTCGWITTLRFFQKGYAFCWVEQVEG